MVLVTIPVVFSRVRFLCGIGGWQLVALPPVPHTDTHKLDTVPVQVTKRGKVSDILRVPVYIGKLVAVLGKLLRADWYGLMS